MHIIKVLICGPPKCGKTSYIDTLEFGHFSGDYLPTNVVEKRIIYCNSNYGKIKYIIYDMPGNRKIYESDNKVDINAIIVMHDPDIRMDQILANIYIQEIRRISSSVPIIKVISKRDNKESYNNNSPDTTFSISSKKQYNLSTPFLYLARMFVSSDLIFYNEFGQ